MSWTINLQGGKKMKMSKIILILLTLCLVACSSTPPIISEEAAQKQKEEIAARKPETIAWRADMAEATAEAKSSKKPIFIFVTCDYTPCKNIERSVMVDKVVVAELNRNFVSVREVVSTEPDALALKYNVQAVPSYVFINEDGILLAKIAGKIDTYDFLTLLDKVRTVHDNS
jgi:thioredoxin-related protein